MKVLNMFTFHSSSLMWAINQLNINLRQAVKGQQLILKQEKKWYGGFEILRMFMLMNLIRVVDLFPNVLDYFRRICSLVTTFNFNILWNGTMLQLGLSGLDYGILGGGIILMFVVSLFQEKKGSVREFLLEKPAVLRYCLIFGLFLIVLLMGSYGIGYNAGNFIYNQF